jgi:hypothetical protein
VFNSLSNDLGGFVEKVQRGAFAQSLNDNDEVHALFNHDSDKVLGRRGSGTLRLWEDDYGLRMELDPPNTTLGNDVVELLKRGDLVSMSFGFYDVDDSWEVRDGANVRTINSARLFDVSIVVNPAYSSASVKLAQRSLEKFQAEKEVEQTNLLGRIEAKGYGQRQRRNVDFESWSTSTKQTLIQLESVLT